MGAGRASTPPTPAPPPLPPVPCVKELLALLLAGVLGVAELGAEARKPGPQLGWGGVEEEGLLVPEGCCWVALGACLLRNWLRLMVPPFRQCGPSAPFLRRVACRGAEALVTDRGAVVVGGAWVTHKPSMGVRTRASACWRASAPNKVLLNALSGHAWPGGRRTLTPCSPAPAPWPSAAPRAWPAVRRRRRVPPHSLLLLLHVVSAVLCCWHSWQQSMKRALKLQGSLLASTHDAHALLCSVQAHAPTIQPDHTRTSISAACAAKSSAFGGGLELAVGMVDCSPSVGGLVPVHKQVQVSHPLNGASLLSNHSPPLSPAPTLPL